MSRRPVAVFDKLFQKDRCGCFSAADPQAGFVLCPPVRHLCDICLEQHGQVLFCFKWNRVTESPPRGPRFPRCPRKTQTRHWPQGHAARCAISLTSVARRSTARPGHFTSFPTMPIQSLFHRTSASLPSSPPSNSCQLGLPTISGRVSAVPRLKVPCPEKLTSRR